MLDFSATQEATLDDQFDATVTLARGFDGMILEDEDSMTEDEEEFIFNSLAKKTSTEHGRSKITGY
jgi:hypothetical protein